MAIFRNQFIDETHTSEQQLLLAVTLFLRTRASDWDQQLNLTNWIRMLVKYETKLYFPASVPSLPKDYVISSMGDVIFAPNAPNEMRFLWVANPAVTALAMESIKYVSVETKVHIRWLEWALSMAMFKLSRAGVSWQTRQPAPTIGGIESADFLSF